MIRWLALALTLAATGLAAGDEPVRTLSVSATLKPPPFASEVTEAADTGALAVVRTASDALLRVDGPAHLSHLPLSRAGQRSAIVLRDSGGDRRNVKVYITRPSV